MNNIFKVSKYLLRDNRKALIIFYAIILTIVFMILSSLSQFNTTDGNVSFGGFGFSSAIFLFISGLNCFKANFMFTQANNISRKRFYFANIITLISLSLLMSLIDVILSNIMQMVIPYRGVFEQLYKSKFFLDDFMWSFALFSFVVSLGWLITMLYYKASKVIKIIISIAPVFVVVLISIIDDLTSMKVWRNIVLLIGRLLGLTNNLNSYTAVVSFFVGCIAFFSLIFLLIRKIPIKD